MKNTDTPLSLLAIFDMLEEMTEYVQQAGFDALNAEELNRQQKRSRRVCSAFGAVRRYTRQHPEGMPMSSLAHLMHMTPSAATHMADAMARQGLINRHPSQEDRRSVLVELTEESLKNAELVEQGRLAAVEKLRRCITAQEQATIERILNKMAKALPSAKVQPKG